MKAVAEHIPEVLIYEMMNGSPIYYNDYELYLNREKTLDELMGSSYLQGLLITELILTIGQLLNLDTYRILINEVGIKLNEKSWRAADIAIYEKQQLKNIALNNKYLAIPPKIIIEIDTKADLNSINNPLGYYQEKTHQLLNFGVEKVIWIFTETQKVLIANQSNAIWQMHSWELDVELLEGIHVNIAALLEKANR